MKSVYAVASLILLVALVMSAGCAAFIPDITGAAKPTPAKAPVKATTAKPTLSPTINVAAAVIPTETALIIKTPTKVPTSRAPTPSPTPTGYYLVVPEVTGYVDPVTTTPVPGSVDAWQYYQNADFKVDRPEGWQAIESLAPQPNPILYGENKFTGDSRLVRFEAGDGKTNFTAQTTDLKVADGRYPQQTGIGWCKDTITPGSGGVITNYEIRYTKKMTPVVSFDVLVPEDSVYLPYAYTERDMASWSHVYTFRFNTPGNLTEYKTIRDRIFDSLRMQEKIKEVNGEFP